MRVSSAKLLRHHSIYDYEQADCAPPKLHVVFLGNFYDL